MKPNPDTGEERPELYKCLACGHTFDLAYYDTPCPQCGSRKTAIVPDEPGDHQDVVDERDEAGDWPDRG